ncbi:MAG: alpha/beta hydrolase [Desulfobacterales bacterium]|nr:alpha/beta hydrolase [Desulfobacterales bacterium]MBF0395722.1 alpha/beta hydrolase [Desulfobacterales bacterium]
MEEKLQYWKNLSLGNLCLSFLNGAIGNFLKETKNELAIEMGFYLNNKLIPLSKKNILKLTPEPTSKICVLLHGLVCNEELWNFPTEPNVTYNENYGTLLQKDYGYTPLFVRYNTGLHVSENGRTFSELMHNLESVYPKCIEEIVIIGHSMGGMVAKSGFHYAELTNCFWQKKVSNVFYLGSPHMGSYVEKTANITSSILSGIKNPITKIISDIINIRSDGIKDMRFGNLIDEDWMGYDSNAFMENNRNYVTLLKNAKHYMFIGTVSNDPEHIANKVFGDFTVRMNSASQGYHKSLKDHVKIFPGIKHLALSHNPEVYNEIKKILNRRTK